VPYAVEVPVQVIKEIPVRVPFEVEVINGLRMVLEWC
jgi:hypothetical protein